MRSHFVFTLDVKAGYVISLFLDFKFDVGLFAVFTEGGANFVCHAEGDIL
jgi:hypothetical protein